MGGAVAIRKHQPWAEFNRFPHAASFFGCVSPEGVWEDSAVGFESAVALACRAKGIDPNTFREAVEQLRRYKWSIVHSDLLRTMYEAGLIK